jgi:hypothetical protein
MLRPELLLQVRSGMVAGGGEVRPRTSVSDSSPHDGATPERKTERRKAERVNFQEQLAALATTDEQRKHS